MTYERIEENKKKIVLPLEKRREKNGEEKKRIRIKLSWGKE